MYYIKFDLNRLMNQNANCELNLVSLQDRSLYKNLFVSHFVFITAKRVILFITGYEGLYIHYMFKEREKNSGGERDQFEA